MTPDDIICGLEALNALVRDPVTGYYALRLDYAAFQAQIDRWEAKGYVKLNESSLIWTPYLMGRSQAEHLNDMPISTIAPRPEEQDADQETMTGDATEDPAAASAGKSAGDEAKGDRTSNSSTLINSNGSTTTQPEQPYTQGEEMRDADFSSNEKPGDPGTSNSSVVNESSARSTPAAAIKLGPELPSSVSNDTEPASRKKPTRSKSSTSLAATPAQVQPNAIDYDIPDIPPTRFEIVPPLPGTNSNNSKKGGRRGAGDSSVLRFGRKRTSISPAVMTPLPSRSMRSITVPGTAPPAISTFASSATKRRTRTKLGQAITVNGDSGRRSETPSSNKNGVVTRDRRERTRETSVAPEIQAAEVTDNGDVQGTNTTTSPTTTDHPSPGIRPGGFNMVVASEV
jgi:histone acetyltransferase SAS3